MKRWTWGIVLSWLVLIGCGRQAPHEAAKDSRSPAAQGGQCRMGEDASRDLEPLEIPSEIATPESDDPRERAVDPTLEKAGHKAETEDYVDDSPVHASKGGGTPAGNKDNTDEAAGLSILSHGAYGAAAKVTGAGGIGVGLGAGRNWGSGGDGVGFGGRGSGHRRAMLANAGGTTHDEEAATAMGLLPFLAAGQAHSPRARDGLDLEGPIETWRPSRLVPNTSRLMVGDNEELPIRGMQVDVRIDGFRARVLLDLYYFNDRPQQLEGSFQLRLPEEASPYFFAFGQTVYKAPAIDPDSPLFFKPEKVHQAQSGPDDVLGRRRGTWLEPKVARMVTREKAAHAYRETVRRRVDPALVEWSGAGVFQCRVFPLAPHTLHRVVIGYDVDLLQAGDDLELRLDLPDPSGARAPACVVDLDVSAGGERQVGLDAPAEKSADGRRLFYRLVNPKERPISVRLRKPGTVMLAGNDGLTGPYFAVRLRPEVPDAPSAAGSKQAVFLVDTSLSAGPQFSAWLKLLRAVLENNRDRIDQFAVLFFNVETFWWQEKLVANTPENVAALVEYADGLVLEGATDLGRALAEAASPVWHKGGHTGPADLFLLSDGAATWGEHDWPALAAALRSAGAGPLFAYRTGLSGSDTHLLARLAEETGGAVFSLVGEAEIARASMAHRSRPWRLSGVEMAGGRDLLLAGRPRFVFPHEQLLLVGRGRPDPAAGIVLTLRQGDDTRRVPINVDRTLGSELAARAYGQVAVGQLEDLADATETVAAAYARHFRVTGRTCSLLMLESEQDYARFQIKPEEDVFVVKDRPASAIVAKAVAESDGLAGDPKATFLAWFRTLEHAPGIRFDLPASLSIALEGLPKGSFTVSSEPLRCKVRAKTDLPHEMREQLAAGKPDYDATTLEAQRRLERYGPADALRVLSSLVEDRPGDAALLRDVAFSAIEWGQGGHAYHLLRRAAAGRTFEPQTYYTLAHCLEQMGRADLACVYYELACGVRTDGPGNDLQGVIAPDYRRFLRRVAGGQVKSALGDYAVARLASTAPANVQPSAGPANPFDDAPATPPVGWQPDVDDLVAIILWNTDGTDVDLHVTEPDGEECYFQHRATTSGGRMTRDIRTGYGPEMYFQPRAVPGTYYIRAQYYSADANRTSSRTKVLALIYQGWGTAAEKATCRAVTLGGRSEMQNLASVVIPDRLGRASQSPKGVKTRWGRPAGAWEDEY